MVGLKEDPPRWITFISALGVAYLAFLSALALLPGLGSSSRLTYHEAFVAQGAREMLNSGNWGYPTIGGLPWLEKPPLPWWLVTAFSSCAGEVNETTARLPSALAATALVLGIAIFATRHYGLCVGLLAGAAQATTAWTVIRGRLAEADILLACLVTWAIVAFDAMFVHIVEHSGRSTARTPGWRIGFCGFARDDVSCEGNWFWCSPHFLSHRVCVGLAAQSGFNSAVTKSSGVDTRRGDRFVVAFGNGCTARLRCSVSVDNACIRPFDTAAWARSICW